MVDGDQQSRRVDELLARLAALEQRVAELEAQLAEREAELARRDTELAQRDTELAQRDREIAELKGKLAAAQKNSSNSSKPPSSDIVKPPKPANRDGQGKRQRGAQKGHPKHERPRFEASEIDQVIEHRLAVCPDCGGDLGPSDRPARVIQQIELPQVPVVISEHRAAICRCEHCQKDHQSPMPPEVEMGQLIGPNLTAYIAYLNGPCRLSISQIQAKLKDVLQIDISRGLIAKTLNKVSESLAGAYDQVGEQIRTQPQLNIDETGHNDNGNRLWTWVFRSPSITYFHIGSRASDELKTVLGEEFDGVINCDQFSAYVKYMGDCDVRVQFCLAHLIRDVKFLAEHHDAHVKHHGQILLDHLRQLFHIIHRRGEYTSESAFEAALKEQKEKILNWANWAVGETCPIGKMASRLKKHGQAYFTFITTPGLDPTNNLAEQALRFVVIHRKLTQGTRSEKGQSWRERIWTVIATCKQQCRSIWLFLCEAVNQYFQNAPPALMLPDIGPSG